MTAPARIVGVIDIGKTNAKFAVVDLSSGAEIHVVRRPNTVLRDGPYPHYDVEALWAFLTDAIATVAPLHPLDALSVTTHGASAALVDADGLLTFPVLDYEHPGPDALIPQYDAIRPAFAQTLTPKLPGGLNVGRQLFYLQHLDPAAFARTRSILTYPQYWGLRLTGIAASEITSIGCHTDLWDFATWSWSSLVTGQRWTAKFPALRPAAAPLGPVRPELAAQLGLRPLTPVLTGIHDSNASLLPHVLTRPAPFSVVSTGTWVVVCAPGGDLAGLDPQRDSFANIDALGRPVPSARFMGGREYSQLTGDAPVTPSPDALAHILDRQKMLLPSVTAGSGPFPHDAALWTPPEATLAPDERFAVVSFYLALMTAECLALAGAKGEIIVEGPFAANPTYLSMLAAATARPVLAAAGAITGTAIGAALLADTGAARPLAAAPITLDPAAATSMLAYARAWRVAATRPRT